MFSIQSSSCHCSEPAVDFYHTSSSTLKPRLNVVPGAVTSAHVLLVHMSGKSLSMTDGLANNFCVQWTSIKGHCTDLFIVTFYDLGID